MSHNKQILQPTVVLEKLDIPIERTRTDSFDSLHSSNEHIHTPYPDHRNPCDLRSRRGLNTTPDSSSLSSAKSERTKCNRTLSDSYCASGTRSSFRLRQIDNVYYRNESEERDSKKPNHRGLSITCAVSVIFLLLFVSAISLLMTRRSKESLTSPSLLQSMTVQLSNDFPNQPKRLWAQLRVALEPQASRLDFTSTELPPMNTVVLFVNRIMSSYTNDTASDDSAHDAAFDCFVHRFRVLLESNPQWSMKCRSIRVSQSETSGSLIKLQLDDQTRNAYKQGFRCFQFPPLDQLPAEAATFFHGTSDAQNTMYKDAILLFTLKSPLKIQSSANDPSNHRRFEHFVQNYLRSLWTSVLGSDETEALLSRLTRTMAVFHTNPGDVRFPVNSCSQPNV